LLQVAELLCRNSGRERTGSIAYSLGWTQHSTGPQMIRASAIIQLLLGNLGRPGGGIQALRGHACIQDRRTFRCCSICYRAICRNHTPSPATPRWRLSGPWGKLRFPSGQQHDAMWHDDVVRGAWADLPKFTVSLLKAWYGAAATPENEFGYQWLPRVDDNSSDMSFFARMDEGDVKGLFVMGQTRPREGRMASCIVRPCGGSTGSLSLIYSKPKTASYWYADPEGGDPKTIPTEVFLVPRRRSSRRRDRLPTPNA